MSRGIITNGLTQDGFGARLQRVLNVMALTYDLNEEFNCNLEYVHTPFSYEGFGEDFSMGENDREIGDNKEPYDEISREGYLKRANLWDNFLGYKGKIISEIKLENYDITDNFDFYLTNLMQNVKNKTTDNKIFVLKYLQKQLNFGYIDFNIIDKHRDKILKNFSIIPENNNNEIIVHIRRKDAIFYGNDRFLSDEYYLEILEKLKPFSQNYKVTIHTQRKNFDYTKYQDWDVCYDDEIEDFELFNKMINCRVLIVGKSSFSITAAMLNNNIIVYPPQPTKGLSRWIDKINFFNLLEKNDKV